MPMDAYREGDPFTVCFDLPGVDPGKIDLNVERNVLTVRAERRPAAVAEGIEMQVFERPSGMFSRQLFLGDTPDTGRTEATYAAGVLTLRIAVAERPGRDGLPSETRTASAPASKARQPTARDQCPTSAVEEER
jgi:HSP20 family protein